MRSLRVCCLCVVYIATLRPRLGKWHCFLQGKTRYRFGFVSVGFLSYFYLPKAKFLIGKVAFQASSNVRSINVLVLCREWYLYFWSVATGWFRVSKFSYFSQSTFLYLKLTIRPFKSKGWLRVWVRSKEALAICISGTTQTTVLDLFDKGCLPPSSVTAWKNTFFVRS